MDRTCIFKTGYYEIICESNDDMAKYKTTYHTQVIYSGDHEWRVDLRNMKIDNWSDANALIRTLCGLMYDITKGVEEACSKK